jgi:hypothetical protein
MKGLWPLQLQVAATHLRMLYLQCNAASDTSIVRNKPITNGAESLGLSRGLSNMNAADQSRLLIPEDRENFQRIVGVQEPVGCRVGYSKPPIKNKTGQQRRRAAG